MHPLMTHEMLQPGWLDSPPPPCRRRPTRPCAPPCMPPHPADWRCQVLCVAIMCTIVSLYDAAQPEHAVGLDVHAIDRNGFYFMVWNFCGFLISVGLFGLGVGVKLVVSKVGLGNACGEVIPGQAPPPSTSLPTDQMMRCSRVPLRFIFAKVHGLSTTIIEC